MNTDFEIITFEYSDLYDGEDRVSAEEVVQAFVKQYVEHLSPEYYPEDEVWFTRGRLWLSYKDKTGGDKPMHVMLIGPITDELVAEIKAAVSKLYVKNCENCGKEILKARGRKWDMCHTCGVYT